MITGRGHSAPKWHRSRERPGAPPVFVAHGDADALVQVEHARAFVRRLRGASSAPVVYAELPGGQHGFDLFRSVRFEAVIDGIEAFAARVLPPGSPGRVDEVRRPPRSEP